MSANVLFGPSTATLEVLLDDPHEHDSPAAARILADLTPEQALTVPPGLPYSIVRIVAHALANMRFNLGLFTTDDPAPYQHPNEMWPLVKMEDWVALASDFLATLEHLKRLCAQDRARPSGVSGKRRRAGVDDRL